MYFEPTGGRKGSKAQLTSYRYYASHPHCVMSFWYFMRGNNIGSLSIILKQKDGSYNELLKLKSDQGDSWRNYNVTIGAHKNFEIIFEAERGDGYLSDIAIDDVQFFDCFAGTFYSLFSLLNY